MACCLLHLMVLFYQQRTGNGTTLMAVCVEFKNCANSAFARSRWRSKPEPLFPPPQHFIVRFAGGVARFGKPEAVVFYSTRIFTGLITRFPPPATVYHLPFSSLIFSDTPDVIYPTTYFSPVSISVKTTSVSQSPLTFTVPNSGCICSDLIMPSSLTSAKVCFF